MATIQGNKLMIEALKRQGVTTIFDLPGDPVGSILAAGRSEGMQTYSMRHEQAAAMAAQAYSYVSQKLGVSIVASGPAMTNAITGLTTAWANCWPMLLIAGNSEARMRGLGDFQETPQVESAAPFCKWSIAIDNPARIPWFVSTAFRKARSSHATRRSGRSRRSWRSSRSTTRSAWRTTRRTACSPRSSRATWRAACATRTR